MSNLVQLAMELATLSMIPTNVDKIIQAGGLDPMIMTLNAVAGLAAVPYQTEVLGTLISAITELTAAGGTMYGNERAIVEACVRVINQHHKKPTAVISALKLLSSVTALRENHAIAMECGVLEAVAVALRSNLENPEVSHNSPCVKTKKYFTSRRCFVVVVARVSSIAKSHRRRIPSCSTVSTERNSSNHQLYQAECR